MAGQQAGSWSCTTQCMPQNTSRKTTSRLRTLHLAVHTVAGNGGDGADHVGGLDVLDVGVLPSLLELACTGREGWMGAVLLQGCRHRACCLAPSAGCLCTTPQAAVPSAAQCHTHCPGDMPCWWAPLEQPDETPGGTATPQLTLEPRPHVLELGPPVFIHQRGGRVRDQLLRWVGGHRGEEGQRGEQ